MKAGATGGRDPGDPEAAPRPFPGPAALAKALWQRRVVRYFLAAVVGASVDFALFALLIYAVGIHYLWAGVGSFMVSTLANYLVSVRVVFQSGSRFPKLMELAVVYAVSATGLFWHQLILFHATEQIGLHVMLSKIVATGIVFFWNYFVRRHFVFATVRR
jgi:putative flippase GtrA